MRSPRILLAIFVAAAMSIVLTGSSGASTTEYEKTQTNNPAQQANRLQYGHPTIYLQGTLQGMVNGAYVVLLMDGATVTEGRYNFYVPDDGSAPMSTGTMLVTQNHPEQDAAPIGSQVWVYGYGVTGAAPVGFEKVDLHATTVSPEQFVTVDIDSCLWVLA